MESCPGFLNNLNNLTDTYARERMADHGKIAVGPSWLTITSLLSLVLGGGLLLVLWYLADWSGLQASLVSLASSAILFIALQLLNPALRYRNMFTAAGFGTVVVAGYGLASFTITVVGLSQYFPFLFDFKSDGSTSAVGLTIPLVFLFALAWLSAHYDIKFREGGPR